MRDFCIERIAVPPALRAEHGVLRAPSLRVAADAGRAAHQILREAHEEAARVRASAQEDAGRAVRQEQERVAARGLAFLADLMAVQQELLGRVEELVGDLAQQTFDRLVLESTPRERIDAMVRRILLEAPGKLVAPVLSMHPDDISAAPDGAWELRSDAGLTPGTCKLEAASGEWRADFELAAAALRTVLGTVAQTLRTPVAKADADTTADQDEGVINLEDSDGDLAPQGTTH